MKISSKIDIKDREIAFDDTYQKLLEVGFGNGSLEDSPEFIDKDVMGYGTALDEKIMSYEDFCELIIAQRKQAGNFEKFTYQSNPVIKRFFNKGNTSLVVDEIDLITAINGENNKMTVRMSTVLEYQNDSWVVVHWHGSLADHISDGEDPWHVEQWKQRTEKLEKMVEEKTSELLIKNRDLEIEASLERIRAQAMAMHNSEDLVLTIDVFFHELKTLNVRPIRCGVGIKEGDSRVVDVTVTSATKNKKDIKITGKLNLGGHPILDKIYEALQQQSEYFPVLRGEEINEYYQAMNPDIEFPNFSEDDIQYGYYFNFKEGGLFAWTEKELRKEELNIFRKFKSVLSLTYRRYLDLKEAEAQAREGQIQLALEKVRLVALGLKKSEEMLEVAKALYEQLLDLGFANIRNAIIDLENGDGVTFTDYDYSHDMSGTITQMSYHDDPTLEGQFKKMATTTDEFFELRLEGKELQDLINMRLKNGEAQDPRLLTAELVTYNLFSFGNGAIGISNFGVLNEEEKIILDRFRYVFTFAYKRYNDLALAEAQAREAKIEAALERVRAKSMAMHKSDELADLSLELVKQVQALGVSTWFCAFNIYDEDSRGSLEWGSNGQGTFPQYRTPREGIFLRYYEAGQRGETLLINEIDENECPAHYDYLCRLPGVGEQLLKMKEAGIPFPTSQIDHVAYFKYGYIIFITFEPALEAHDIFKRFAGVFEQTYTRFLDLQKSEEQRIIIQAENDRKTQELEEARQLQLAMLPKEIPQLSKLDIAVYMQTATEVGGDYYDFSTKDDGSLNICLGDATGHGLKAGTLVSMIKSLFVSDSVRLGIKEFFVASNETLKKMSLNKMMMAFAMINIYGNEVKIANAGIPPIYIFRKSENIIEEINVNGMPIGAMKNSKYEVHKSKINSGDVILMLSDGLPELQNKNDEMYGYEKLQKTFLNSASNASEEIIEQLVSESNIWRGETEPDDDITFVVIKVI